MKDLKTGLIFDCPCDVFIAACSDDDYVDGSGSIRAPDRGLAQIAHLRTSFPVPGPPHLHSMDGNATSV